MTDQSDATQADADAQSQADTLDTRESQADSQHDALSLEEAKKLRSEAQNLRKRLKDAEATAQAAEARQRELDEAKAKEEGRYKELLEAREKELAEIQKQITDRDLKDKRTALARKHSLPDEIADRLVGETDDEIEEDAKRLARLFAKTDGVDTDSGKRSAQANGKQKSESLLASYQFDKKR
jgi:hypothetical protein